MISTLGMSLASILGGLIIAFLAEWRLGLVGLVTIPMMVGSGLLTMIFFGSFGDRNKQYY